VSAPDTTTSESRDLAFAGIAGQARLLAEKQVSSRELVELSLSRIEATQPTLNAFRVVCAERARADAEEADRRLGGGESVPLLGVPVAIKDDTDLAGEATPFGCLGEFEPKRCDAEVVRRLRAAGAVVVGKTNTPEVGQWPFTEGPAFGVTRNPWHLDHSPGGSSGGSATAVAAGLVPGAIGSDGAGSVRIPASWTNLVGLKPQRGRISTWPDPEAFNGLTVFGPITRTVEDTALLLDLLSGNVDGDRHRPPAPAEPFAVAVDRPPRTLRIALSLSIPYSGAPARLEPEVQGIVEGFAARLEAFGHSVERADVPWGLTPGGSIMPRALAGLAEWVERVPDETSLDPRTRHNARVGRLLSPLVRVAHGLEALTRRRVGKTFRDYDLILSPVTARPAHPIGACDGLTNWETDKTIVAACPYAWPWNVLGWPGLSVPAGFTGDGLPIGAQLLGPANSESLLLSLAAQLEAAELWQERRPPQPPAENGGRDIADGDAGRRLSSR
jgi:amidase